MHIFLSHTAALQEILLTHLSPGLHWYHWDYIPLCSNPTNGSWFPSESKSKSLWPTRPYAISAPSTALSLWPAETASLPASLQSSHPVLALPQTHGKTSHSGCYLWLLHSFSRYSRGETSYILQCFAYISLFNEDNLAHSIKNATFISINLSSFSNFSFPIVLIFCQIRYFIYFLHLLFIASLFLLEWKLHESRNFCLFCPLMFA